MPAELEAPAFLAEAGAELAVFLYMQQQKIKTGCKL